MAYQINEIKRIVGNNIRKYRELKGMTQEELIEKIGIGVSSLSNIECGKTFPTSQNLNKIINILDIEPDLLFKKEITNTEAFEYEDFNRRFNLIKNNKEKFKILYEVLKVLS